MRNPKERPRQPHGGAAQPDPKENNAAAAQHLGEEEMKPRASSLSACSVGKRKPGVKDGPEGQ